MGFKTERDMRSQKAFLKAPPFLAFLAFGCPSDLRLRFVPQNPEFGILRCSLQFGKLNFYFTGCRIPLE
jgi:hypothetical protein